MIDILAELKDVHRATAERDADETVEVTLRRTYPTPPDDLWSALTDPERLRRWFWPVSGDPRVGGSFQVEGMASGDILACDAPRHLRLTYGGETSIVEVELAPVHDGEDTELTLRHSVPVAIAQSVAGALYVGPGWDGALLGLAKHVARDEFDPVSFADSPEVVEFNRHSIDLWTEVATAAGAPEADVTAARGAALAQFVPGDEGM